MRPIPSDAMPPPAVADGVRPSLAELIALRGSATRLRAWRGYARQGWFGPVPAASRGRGMEYVESRAYVAGDDARHIDWRVTARTGRAHTKQFQAERERLSLIVADTAPALYFGTRVRYKSVQAARAAAVMAWLAQCQGDRIAALRGSDREPPIAPAAGQRGVLRVLDALVRWYAQRPDSDTGLALALEHAGRILRPGARLSVFADARSAAALPDAQWSALALHHDVLLVLLVDPLELTPPPQPLAFAAGEQRVVLDLSTAESRRAWHDQFVEPLRRLQTALPAHGVRVHVLATSDSSDAWLASRAPPPLE